MLDDNADNDGTLFGIAELLAIPRGLLNLVPCSYTMRFMLVFGRGRAFEAKMDNRVATAYLRRHPLFWFGQIYLAFIYFDTRKLMDVGDANKAQTSSHKSSMGLF